MAKKRSAKEAPEPTPPACAFVPVEIPLANPDGTYAATNVHVRFRTEDERQGFAAYRKALTDSHAQLACGKHVDTNVDAVRYLFAALGRLLPEAREAMAVANLVGP